MMKKTTHKNNSSLPSLMKNISHAKGAAFLVIAFLIILQTISAADYPYSWDKQHQGTILSGLQYFKAPGGGSQGSWYLLSIYAIMVCLLANALVYVAAKVFNSQSTMRFAISEFYNVSASAIMIFLLAGMGMSVFAFLQGSGFLPAGTSSKCYGAQVDVWKMGPPAIVQCKIQEKIEYVEGLYSQAYKLNEDNEPLSSLCIYIMSVQAYCWDWDVSLHATVEKAHLLANKIMPIAINLHAQYMFVSYIANNMLSLFLPIGLILRIFPILRGIGSIMIAIAIAFFFVFPITFLILDPDTVRPNPADLIQTHDNNFSPCYSSFSGMVTAISQKPPNVIDGTVPPDASQVGKELASLQAEAFLIPLAALTASLIFISSATPILGGDAGELMRFVAKVI